MVAEYGDQVPGHFHLGLVLSTSHIHIPKTQAPIIYQGPLATTDGLGNCQCDRAQTYLVESLG